MLTSGSHPTLTWSLVHRAGVLCAALGGALGSGSAHAQFDYSVYGVADLSYGRFEPAGLYRQHRLNSNSMTATFAGVSGSYGFDNGLAAGVTLETFYRFQDLRTGRNNNDPLLSRNAFVSLAHAGWGQVRLGRLQTLLFNTTTRFNALGNSVGFSPAVRHLFAAGNLIGVQGDFYWDRAIGYTSPKIGDVTIAAMNAWGDSEHRGRLTGLNAIYARSLLAVSASWQHVRLDPDFADAIREQTAQLGLSYNFGWAQAFGQYTHISDTGLQVTSRIVSAGLSTPVGPGKLQLQGAHARALGDAVDRRQQTWSLGYLYEWDSTLDLYAVGMDDRVWGQTVGRSLAVGARYRF